MTGIVSDYLEQAFSERTEVGVTFLAFCSLAVLGCGVDSLWSIGATFLTTFDCR